MGIELVGGATSDSVNNVSCGIGSYFTPIFVLALINERGFDIRIFLMCIFIDSITPSEFRFCNEHIL